MTNPSTGEWLRFSIIIPCYNYARFLDRALDSAISQPGEDYEIIVIDDGSTDDTNSVVSEYLSNPYCPHLHYHHQNNLGPSAARNSGVKLSRGQFLIFLDADDELVDGALDYLRPIAEAKPNAGLLVGGHYTAHEDGSLKYSKAKHLSRIRTKNFVAYLTKKISIANGAVAINRMIFEKTQYPEGLAQAEDIPVFGQAFANFDCYSISEPLARVHRHEDSRRGDITLARKAGFQVIDRLFNPELLPAECMRYRDYFYVRKCLSLFRHFHKEGLMHEATAYYHKALKKRPFTALRPSYLSKYLRILLKKLLMDAKN